MLAMVGWLLPPVSTALSAPIKHFKVIYKFTGGKDGAFPAAANLFQDAAGNLYGTTVFGGDVKCSEPYAPLPGCGVVFKLDAAGKETILHTFEGVSDGAEPYGSIIQDAEGNVYGTTDWGGSGSACSCGVVFKLTPKGKETTLYNFTGQADGGLPVAGLVMDERGNLYGTTSLGGDLNGVCGTYSGCGTVFKVDSNGKETVLYAFTGGADGNSPEYGPLVRDSAGNLYGTTSTGGNCVGGEGCGIVFKVSTEGTETVLYRFHDGTDNAAYPNAGLIRDRGGNLYSTTQEGGDPTCDCGLVFKLKRDGKEKVLHNFTGGPSGSDPYYGQLTQDAVGNLYGTTLTGGDSSCGGASGCGVVYKLTALGKEKVLYTFTGYSTSLWAAGNLYGTAARGGNLSACDGNGCGLVYEVSP